MNDRKLDPPLIGFSTYPPFEKAYYKLQDAIFELQTIGVPDGTIINFANGSVTVGPTPAQAEQLVEPRKLKDRPKNFRWMTGGPLQKREKAWQMPYHDWILWIAVSALVQVEDQYAAPQWALDSSKQHPSARHKE
jgi:hypothetical protein